jgi:CBS domain-containing protein
MPTVQDVLARKRSMSGGSGVSGGGPIHGGDVVVISPRATVLEAAERMNYCRIGALVVVDTDDSELPSNRSRDSSGNVVGMFTERDVLTRVVAARRDPANTMVMDVMTSPVITCSPATTSDELRQVMREKRVRHVPVADSGRLVGLVSIGDINTVDVQVMVQTIEYLEQFMYRG